MTFLDIKKNKYLSLEKEQTSLLLAQKSETNRADLLKALVSSGLFEWDGGDGTLSEPQTVQTAEPVRSFVEMDSGQVNPLSVALALIFQIWIGFLMQLLPLKLMLAAPPLSCSHEHDLCTDATILQAAKAFEQSCRWLASSRQCLRRSIALRHYLARFGIAIDLVIGVKLDPFGAHAWCQHGDMVLNDCTDNVLQYTPVMVS